jgi:hypothetical protein
MDQQPYPAMNDQPYAWQAAAPKKVNMIYVAGAIVGAVLLVFAVSMLIFSLNPDPSNLAELNRANSPEQTDP